MNIGVTTIVAVVAVLVPTLSLADSKVIARIDGVEVTQSDIDFAATELGPMLSRHSEDDRKRVLVSYVIENQLMADAAVEEKLDETESFDSRRKYHDRRALADAYFAERIKDAVPEEEAKKFYDETYKPQEQAHVRHILLKSEEEAKRVAERLEAGESFATLAEEKSEDKAKGGDLGFIARGQTVKPFEEAAFSLKVGEVSKPVETKFGWHIIQVEERRNQPPPPFEKEKQKITTQLLQARAQKLIAGLRDAVTIEYTDPEVRDLMEAEAKPSDRTSGTN